MKEKCKNSSFPKELLGPWNDIDQNKLDFPINFKFRNRNKMLVSSWNNLNSLIPKCLTHQHLLWNNVIDISCGNGACLEIMKFFGYNIFGLDYYDKLNEYGRYDIFLKSQKIPYVEHNCLLFPYPIESKSFDVLINIGAITQYSNDLSIWPTILDEFARITKNIICISVNHGWKYDQGKKLLLEWKNPRFKLVYRRNHLFRWESI